MGGAIGSAAFLTFLLTTPAGWLLAPFASTVTYLLVLGVQFSVADERGPEGQDGTKPDPAKGD